MTKREKIILSLVAVAVVYGLFALVSGLPRRGGAVAGAESARSQTEVSLAETRAAVAEGNLTDAERCVLDRAQGAWVATPFIADPEATVPSAAPELPPSAVPPRHRYSGYLDVAGRRMAIVDGREYRVGEEMLTGQTVVETIEADKVVLRRKRDGAALTVPVDGARSK
jgi:hypothetical protein